MSHRHNRVKLSYQRLRIEEEDLEAEILEKQVKKAKAWLKFKALLSGRRRRPRVKIPGLRRFLRKRSKFLFNSFTQFPWRKALHRLKNGQSHFNELFGGNHLLMH